MRALIVEDDATLSRMLSRCLTSWGWLADEAPRVSAARDSFKPGSHDLLLCGVELPDGDGISLAQELLKIKPSLIVIIISGTPENLTRSREVGLTACLHEPFSLDDLRALNELEQDKKAASGRRVLVGKKAPKNDSFHVLLVEDDPAQLASAWDILEDFGCRVTAAENAEAALLLVEQTLFDVILTDNILPGMTGFQALPRLRASGAPVIVMSSRYDHDTEKDACLLGAAAFIKKPLDVEELSQLIRPTIAARNLSSV